MAKFILASASPRRKELLSKIIDDFEIIPSTNEEKLVPSLSNYQKPVYLAKQKAKNIFKDHPNDIIIAADTIVIVKNKILGKPKSFEDARNMISLLNNRIHTVVTGVCVKSKDKEISFNSKTFVKFAFMSDEEINNYCKDESIYDKAGAYAIQGLAGKYILSIDGDYYNVVGLPLSKLYSRLKEFKEFKDR